MTCDGKPHHIKISVELKGAMTMLEKCSLIPQKLHDEMMKAAANGKSLRTIWIDEMTSEIPDDREKVLLT